MSDLRAVILTGPGFQDHDVIYTYYRLVEAGYEVDVATDGGRSVTGKYGVRVPLDRLAPECIPFEVLAVEDYDLVVLTGGHEAPDRVRQIEEVRDFVAGMDRAGKVVAGLCHGPWIMISAGIMRGRRACAYVGMRDDMENAGADVRDTKVEVDGNIVTCSYYGHVGPFMKAVIELVAQRTQDGAARPTVAG
jgi:protease I